MPGTFGMSCLGHVSEQEAEISDSRSSEGQTMTPLITWCAPGKVGRGCWPGGWGCTPGRPAWVEKRPQPELEEGSERLPRATQGTAPAKELRQQRLATPRAAGGGVRQRRAGQAGPFRSVERCSFHWDGDRGQWSVWAAGCHANLAEGHATRLLRKGLPHGALWVALFPARVSAHMLPYQRASPATPSCPWNLCWVTLWPTDKNPW